MQYRQLDEQRILRTLGQLRVRVAERFPNSGLSRVAAELESVGGEVMQTVEYLKRPNYLIRLPVWVLILSIAASAIWVLVTVVPKVRIGELEFVQVFEAGANDVVLIGIAIWFLLSIETKIKRKRALSILHELRSLAHVVDMHQLSKDPEIVAIPGGDPFNPDRLMTAEELGRYLDFCTELLSGTSKLAAILVQHFSDEVVLGTVNEIEALTAGLSGRIWQKITLIDRAGPG